MFEKQIEAGVAYLDEHYGRDVWLPRIDLDILTLDSNSRCIIGQLEGSYAGTGISNETADACGFYISYGSWLNRPGSASRTEEYEILTEEWKATITALRG